ncbi:MAG: hypothetical protein ACWGQW_16705, partial [bacterium]
AQILQRWRIGDNEWLVICWWQGSPHPYVTWKVNTDGEAYFGHYWGTYEEAHYDFLGRLQENTELYGTYEPPENEGMLNGAKDDKPTYQPGWDAFNKLG